VDQPPLREGGVVSRTWIAALGEEVVLYEVDLPACCRRSASGAKPQDGFECPSCGAVWQTPLPEPGLVEEDAFMRAGGEEEKGAA
jgi:DNA-binding helix-hairpin-helix protein with protein kinase domain